MESKTSKPKRTLPPNDLRHKLTLIRQGQHAMPTGPPPDPPFNFLKDPMRDNVDGEDGLLNERNMKSVSRGNRFHGSNRGRTAPSPKFPKKPLENRSDWVQVSSNSHPVKRNFEPYQARSSNQNSDKPNEGHPNKGITWAKDPVIDKRQTTNLKPKHHAPSNNQKLINPLTNIKVEVSEQGERKCVMDESKNVSLKLSNQKEQNRNNVNQKYPNKKWNSRNTTNKSKYNNDRNKTWRNDSQFNKNVSIRQEKDGNTDRESNQNENENKNDVRDAENGEEENDDEFEDAQHDNTEIEEKENATEENAENVQNNNDVKNDESKKEESSDEIKRTDNIQKEKEENTIERLHVREENEENIQNKNANEQQIDNNDSEVSANNNKEA